MRQQVKNFAAAMEHTLQRHDNKDGWYDCTPEWLLMRLKQEVEELTFVIRDRKFHSHQIVEAKQEAIDVANFAMMIWDVLSHPPAGGSK